MAHGIHRALATFKTAVSVSPAYRALLRKKKIKPTTVRDLASFNQLPITDKKNFIHKHAFAQLFENSAYPPFIYASSGSSGQPTYWLQGDEQESMGGRIHEQIFRDIFDIKKSDATLVIVCFSMGMWVAGNYTAAACRNVARMGYNLSVVTPSIEMENIVACLRDLAPHFKHVILAGYPPFLVDVFKQAKQQKVQLPPQLRLLTAGDKVEEKWRDIMVAQIPHGDTYRSHVNIYGCADATVMAIETPLSIFIRRSALKDKPLARLLFGSEEKFPALFQYDDREIYFETVNNELVFTVNTAIPLVRYNIHDVGAVIPHELVTAALRERGMIAQARKLGLEKWKYPFVAKYGRTDVAVTTYALNIYPEHIRDGLEKTPVKKHVSGNYFAYNTIGRSAGEKLHLNIELAPGAKDSKKLLKLITASIVEHLLQVNMEYRKLFSNLGSRVVPFVRLFRNGDQAFTAASSGLVNIKGKKPRVVLPP